MAFGSAKYIAGRYGSSGKYGNNNNNSKVGGGQSLTASGGAPFTQGSLVQNSTRRYGSSLWGQDEDEEEKNRGGLLGGIGYAAGNAVLGVGTIVEGLSDLLLAGGALLVGDTDYAEWVFKDNTVGSWRESLNEAYNPDEVMSFVGDVGHGVGQSSAFLLDAVAPGLGTGLFFAGMSSQGISGAAAQTGEVGAKEIIYGVASGGVEAVLGTVLSGASNVAKSVGKSAMTSLTKNAAKSTFSSVTKNALRQGIGKKVLSSAASEFAEEFTSTYADALLQRITGVDPNATVTLKEALYAGAVGAVSGGLTTGVAGVTQNAHNAKRGARIISNGNADIVINEANHVADRIAAQGTDFENAQEWITALRGEVDAYNALSPEAKVGLRGKTILGEMQASLYFAETQANVDLIKKGLKKKTVEDKEALAAYVNRVTGRKYTATDIDNNTDNLTGQLAVLHYASGIMNMDADMLREQGIGNKIATEQGTAPAVNEVAQGGNEVTRAQAMPTADNAQMAQAVQSEAVEVGETKYDLKSAIKTLGEYDSVRKRHIESSENDKISRDYNEIAEFINTASKDTPVKRLHIGVVNNDVADMVKTKTNVDIKDYDFVIASNFIAHIFDEHGNPKNETPRGQIAVDKNNIEDIIETVIQPDDVSITQDNQGAKALKFEKDINGRNVAITITSTKKSTLTLKSAWIINKKSGGRTPSANTKVLAGTSKTNGRSSTTNIIHQNDPKVNTQSQNNFDKKDLTRNGAKIAQEGANDVGGTVEGGAQQMSAGGKSEAEAMSELASSSVTDESATPSPALGKAEVESEAKSEAESADDIAARKARAEERAKKWAEWEENTKPTAEELNAAREYVKGFDSLENSRRLAIIRMIRSAEGKVDAKIVKGVANLMAMRKKNGQSVAPDLEFRFVDGMKEDTAGLRTHIGDKVVVLIDSSAEYSDTIRGTIAHELVHYIENKEGYEALAKFARSTATEAEIKEIKAEYIADYEARNQTYTQDMLDQEVAAKLVGKALNSEKFLARYAQMDDKLIKKVGRFLKGIVTSQKDDADVSRVAAKMMAMFDKALQSESVGETSGTQSAKYSLRVKHTNGTETIVNPYETTREQMLEYMRMSRKGQLENHTYFPVSSDTSKTIIATLKNANIDIDNRPLAMQADKARQSQIDAKPLHKNGFTIRYHAMSSEKILEVIDKLDEATAIIHQRNRTTTKEIDGVKQIVDLPDNFAVFVTLEDGKEYVAIIEFNAEINSDYILEDGNGDKYHTTVTVFEPDVERDGEPFDYIEYLLLRGDNEELDIIKENPESEAAIRQTEATASKKEFSNNSIPQKSDLSTQIDKKDLAPKKKKEDAKEKSAKKTEQKTDDVKKLRKMSEQIAKEKAKLSREQNAKVFTKQEVGVALDSIEALTDIEVLRLANGMELQSLTRERREELVSKIYIALHNASAEGESGRGSVVVKGIATTIAQDIIDHARLVDENGKSYHFKDVYDEASLSRIVQDTAQTLYESFANMGTQTSNSSFQAAVRAVKEDVNVKYANDRRIAKESREVSFQATRLRDMVQRQKRGIEDDGISLLTKALGSIVDAKGNIVISRIDPAIAEAERFFAAQDLKKEEGGLTTFARDNDMELRYLIDELKSLREGREGKPLDGHELQLLGKILGGMHRTIKEYNQVFVNGHWMDADKVASDSATDITSFFGDKQYSNAVTKFLGEKVGKRINELYFYNILSPENVIEALEGYKNGGVLKTLYHSIRVAKQRSEHLSVQLKKPFAEFLDAKGEVELSRDKKTSANDDLISVAKEYGINITEKQMSDNAEHVVNMDNVAKLTGKEFEADGKTTLKDKVIAFFEEHNNRVETKELGTVALTKTSFSDDKGHGLTRNKIVSFSAIPEVLQEGKVIDVYKPQGKPYIRVTVAAPIYIEGQKYYMGVMVQKDNQSNRMYLHDVITEKATLSLTNGANRQNGEGIRDEGHLFITSILQKRLSVNTSEQNNNSENNAKIDPTWKDEKGRKRTYRQKLNEKIVNVNGNEITLGEGIYLYMLTKREHTHEGLREAGFVTYDDNNQRKKKFKIEDVEAARDFLWGQFDAADKAYIAMAEEFFNKTATDIKAEADMEILGFTNNLSGYYVPIIRDRYSRMQGVTDAKQSVGSIPPVYNKSFTKNTVQNAKALEGKNIQSIINDHADGLADYKEMYLPLKAFDRVYNRRVVLSDGTSTTIREVLNNDVWNGSQNYLKNLFSDIQGDSRRRDGFVDDVVGRLRSGWVNSVLGLNLKVVATQTTSYVAANQVIEAKYLVPAIAKFVGNQSDLATRADKYSDIIEARSFDMGSLKAQGNVDRITGLGKKSGFMIEAMDRRVCMAIFHAAELKAEAQGHGKVGTVENAKAAAKIADEVIYTTQAMTSQAERSALQRSPSEIAKAFSMFTSDTVKNLSHTWSSVMRYIAHSQRAKTDATYQQGLKKDARKIGRSAATMAMTGVMLGLITQAFKYLYAKEEEEPEDKVEDLATDIVSSTLNVFPIFSEIVDKFYFGYDMSLNVLDIANDTIEDTKAVFDMAGKAMSGQFVSDAEIGKTVINAAKTVGNIIGAPIAPLERTVTGLLRRFAPQTVYDYDAMFKNASYTKDLKKAVESGDEELAEHILTSLYKNEATGVYASEELEEIVRLYGLVNEDGKHPDVLPQRIGTEIDGVTLSAAQRRQFEAVYGGASNAVVRLISSDIYRDMTDEERIKAIKNTYKLYYNRAKSATLGTQISKVEVYSSLLGDKSELYVLAQAKRVYMQEYKNRRGKKVTIKDQVEDMLDDMKLSKSERLIMLYALGYTGKENTEALIKLINSLKLHDEELAQIAAALGFAVEKGKVVEKDDEAA